MRLSLFICDSNIPSTDQHQHNQTNIMTRNIIDETAARELELYARNFSGTHWNTCVATLHKFYKRGDYSHDRAIGYISRYLCVPAAKDYHLCCGSMTQSWNSLFNKPTRDFAAECIAEELHSDFVNEVY